MYVNTRKVECGSKLGLGLGLESVIGNKQFHPPVCLWIIFAMADRKRTS